MSHCAICGRVESFDKGSQIERGWACSRCSAVWNTTATVNTVATTSYQGAELAGFLGTLSYNDAEKTAIRKVVALGANTGSAETIWGVGLSAYHETTPSANIVIVYRFAVNGTVTIYAIGNHKGKTNNEYFVLRWNGTKGRVTR